jgi:hypothetical protein
MFTSCRLGASGFSCPTNLILGLDPASAPAGLIAAICAIGHNALEAELERRLLELEAKQAAGVFRMGAAGTGAV